MTKQEAAADALVSMIDELGDLETEVAPYKAKLKRADALRAAIRGRYAGAPPDAVFVVDGDRFRAVISAKGNESVVDNAALYKLAGPKLFVEIASVSLKAITDKCGAAMLGAVVSIEQSGSRSLVVQKQ
jgi:hypothetical protein